MKGYVSQDSLQKAEGGGSGTGYAILALDNDDLWWREMTGGKGRWHRQNVYEEDGNDNGGPSSLHIFHLRHGDNKHQQIPRRFKHGEKETAGTLLHEEYLFYTLFFLQNEANSALPLCPASQVKKTVVRPDCSSAPTQRPCVSDLLLLKGESCMATR